MNRLGLKISCFLISVVIWFQVALTTDIEQVTDLPLRVDGLVGDLTVTGSDFLPSDIRVRVTGSKWTLLTHQYFNRYIGEVRVNLANYADTTFSYPLKRSNIFTDMHDADIQGDNVLKLTIDHEISRPIAVTLDIGGDLPQGMDFVTTPRITPDSVLVTGPSRFFHDDLSVYTEEVNLGRISGNLDQMLSLNMLGKYLELDGTEVQVEFRVGKLEDRILVNIPVIGLVDAGRPEVGISPPVADVMVRGIADSVRALTKDRISVIVPVDNLPEGNFVLKGQVIHHLDWLTLLRLDPPQFQVIVGNPPILRNESQVPADEENQGE